VKRQQKHYTTFSCNENPSTRRFPPRLAASDYSLTVLDPCYDATDPDEWQRFFSKYEPNGDVVCVTVAVDNQALTSLLLDQRQLRYEIAAKLMVDEVYDEEIGERRLERRLERGLGAHQKY